MKKVIIDCDTGTDDAIALICALLSDQLDIQAITTVAGNVDLKYTARNTLNLMRCLGSDVPIAVGASQPLFENLAPLRCSDIHGSDGLGGINIPDSNDDYSKESAVETIRTIAQRGSLEIIAIGPVTNIALAIMTYPEIKKLVNRITFMGGAIKGGNATKVAEFNVRADPEAARIVLHSGIPITMIGLDVTEQVVINEDDYQAIKKIESKEAKIVSAMVEFMFERMQTGVEGAVMHDALAIASVANPGLIKTKDYYVDVETKGEYTRGYTFVDTRKETDKEVNCNVAIEVEAKQVKEWIFKTMLKSEENKKCATDSLAQF